MTIVEQIRAEVERLKETAKLMKVPTYKSGWNSAINAVLQLLSTLKEQPVCDGLEEAAFKYVDAHCAELYKSFETHYDKDKKCLISILTSGDVANINQFGEDAFKAGAEWQKEQMMKGAVEGEIEYNYDEKGRAYYTIRPAWITGNIGDKVRFIIVEED